MNKIGMERMKREFHSTKYYVNAVKKETVRTDHPQQRESGQWSTEYRDGLIGTILKNEDIPYIVLCEQVTGRGVDNYLIDGIQRVTTIFNYRAGAFKLGNKMEHPMIEYQINLLDERGRPMRDEHGHLMHETVMCDIRGKGYRDLPDELQELFDEYQLEEIKHLHCSDDQIGYHLRRYNHAKKMGASQNGMTYLDQRIAMQVKELTSKHTFFRDLGNFKPAERRNDTLNRVVLESVMATYFLDDWKSPLKDICLYLNEHMGQEMLSVFKEELDYIVEDMTDAAAEMFTSKNSFLWFVTLHKFCETGHPMKRFIEYMERFQTEYHCKKWNGTTFDAMNRVSTKKKSCIIEKLQLLEQFLHKYLNQCGGGHKSVEMLDFVQETVHRDVNQEDIDFFGDMLEDLSLAVDPDTSLLEPENRPSLIAVIGYACKQDIDLDEWFAIYFRSHKTYKKNQKENLSFMIKNLHGFMQRQSARRARSR